MRNKFLVGSLSLFVFALMFTVGAYAARGQSANLGVGTEAQIQVMNQGEDTQIKTQTETQAQVQARAYDDDEYEADDVNDDRYDDQYENRARVGTTASGTNERMLQVRSQVATAVQNMLSVADRHEGIGEQVRVIAQNQNKNMEDIDARLQKIEKRGEATKFLFGPNYSEIRNVEKILEQNRAQIQTMNEIKAQITAQADLDALNTQIQTLEQANIQIEEQLKAEQEGFSLLGWLFKMFAK